MKTRAASEAMIEFAFVRGEIAAPAKNAWALLADFGHPQILAPSIVGCTMTGKGVGAIRIVESARGLFIHERLVECDPAAYRLRYDILDAGDMPFEHVASYICTVVLRPAGDRLTEIEWRSEGRAEGPVEPIRAFLCVLYKGANRRLEARAQASV